MRPAPEFEAGALWLSRLDPAHEFGATEREKVLSVVTSIEWFEARTNVREAIQLRPASFLLVEGIAGCARRTATGARQIVAILVPGDLWEDDEGMEERRKPSLICMSECRIAFISDGIIDELGRVSPKLRSGIRRMELEQRTILEEWLVNLGQRPAAPRLANLFCELFERLERVGLVRTSSCALPLSQQDLGDISGLSINHVNRMVRQFRQSGLLSFSGGLLHVLDLPRLYELGEFAPNTFFEPFTTTGAPGPAGPGA